MPGNHDKIVMFEPQCWGFEHSTFNAAFLQTIRLAYPNANIVFCGEKDHLSQVQAVLFHNGCRIDNVEWKEILIFRRNEPKWKRLRNDSSWCSAAIKTAQCANAELLVICSINNTGIFALKSLMHIRRFQIPTLAVVHGSLADLLVNRSWRPWSMSNALAFPPPGSLRLVALGESIYQEVLRIQPSHKSQWIVMDHPYLWPALSSRQKHSKKDNPRFGFLGSANTGKGFDLFCNLADKIGPEYPNAEFILAGFYYGFNANSHSSRYVQGVSDKPLSASEFQKRVGGLTYTVWLAQSDHYRLTASATFLDSMAYLKPGIYLRNYYIQHYFDKMGDIGYLCDSFEEIVSTVRSILRDFPDGRYTSQVTNLLAGRNIFGSDRISGDLRLMIETMTSGEKSIKR